MRDCWCNVSPVFLHPHPVHSKDRKGGEEDGNALSKRWKLSEANPVLDSTEKGCVLVREAWRVNRENVNERHVSLEEKSD